MQNNGQWKAQSAESTALEKERGREGSGCCPVLLPGARSPACRAAAAAVGLSDSGGVGNEAVTAVASLMAAAAAACRA